MVLLLILLDGGIADHESMLEAIWVADELAVDRKLR